MLNKEEIKKIIPQREPFLMIDEVEEYTPGQGATAYKYVDESEVYTASLNLLYNRIRESLQGNLEQVLLRNKKKNK